MTIEFKPLSDALGAEVVGVNVSESQTEKEILQIREGWLRYKILLFRGQDLTIEQQKTFAQHFGELKMSPNAKTRIPEHPEVGVFSNIKINGKDIGGRPDRSFGDAWHSDFSFLPEPAGGSFFYAKEVPGKGGDDTWYANLVKAYEALSEDMKNQLEELRWTYSFIKTEKLHAHDYKPRTVEVEKRLPDVTHPFVRTHPETGQKALFVGILDTRESSVTGMSGDEGVKFLDKMKAHATQTQFTYAHQWIPGDCMLWDNRCTMHRGSIFPDSNGRRLCYRITLAGGVPY